MSRPLRIEYPGAWYHLMNRGRRGDNIFEVDEDRDMFITVLKEASSLWGVHISSFCLMDNHYHLLTQTPQGNLSRFMRHLNGVYTQRFNRLHGHDGQLFRGRYKSVIVGEDSHPGYLSNAKKWAWLYKGFVLSMLSIEKKKQKSAYLEFMGQGDSEQFENLFAKEKWPMILGDEGFVSWVKETFFTSKQNREIPDSRQLAPEVDHIVTTVSSVYVKCRSKIYL
ncbi:MAG: transposase [Thermodesulfobacteriota bacterium]|nr:transposase [Thermodesulfobacteriota bacterium]